MKTFIFVALALLFCVQAADKVSYDLWPSLSTPVEVTFGNKTKPSYNTTGMMDNLALMEEIYKAGTQAKNFCDKCIWRPISKRLDFIYLSDKFALFGFNIIIDSGMGFNESIRMDVSVHQIEDIKVQTSEDVRLIFNGRINEGAGNYLVNYRFVKYLPSFKNRLDYTKYLKDNNLTQTIIDLAEKDVNDEAILFRGAKKQDYKIQNVYLSEVSINSDEDFRYMIYFDVDLFESRLVREFVVSYSYSPSGKKFHFKGYEIDEHYSSGVRNSLNLKKY